MRRLQKLVQSNGTVRVDDGAVWRCQEAYLDCEVQGVGEGAGLYFDRREVVLPTVPLSVVSDVTFHVHNHGFDNCQLRLLFPEGLGFTFTFPDGEIVSLAKKKLPIKVSFVSKKSCSITTDLVLLDASGTKYSIKVLATADNSLFSTAPYLAVHAGRITIDGRPGKAIQARFLPNEPSTDFQTVIEERGHELQRKQDGSEMGSLMSHPSLHPQIAEAIATCPAETIDVVLQWANCYLFLKPVR